MPRPANRVDLCQELARLRSAVTKTRKRLPATIEPGSADAWAAWWIHGAVHLLKQAEEAYDDPKGAE